MVIYYSSKVGAVSPPPPLHKKAGGLGVSTAHDHLDL